MSARSWRGIPLPDDLDCDVHDDTLVLRVPLTGWGGKFVRGFAIVWASIALLMGLPILVAVSVNSADRFELVGGLCFSLPLIAAGTLVWRRRNMPARVTLRSGSRWISTTGPTSWRKQRMPENAVKIEVRKDDRGYVAGVVVAGFTIHRSAPRELARDAKRDVYAFASELSAELGLKPVPSPGRREPLE